MAKAKKKPTKVDELAESLTTLFVAHAVRNEWPDMEDHHHQCEVRDRVAASPELVEKIAAALRVHALQALDPHQVLRENHADSAKEISLALGAAVGRGWKDVVCEIQGSGKAKVRMAFGGEGSLGKILIDQVVELAEASAFVTRIVQAFG